jgi:hypothetical protein
MILEEAITRPKNRGTTRVLWYRVPANGMVWPVTRGAQIRKENEGLKGKRDLGGETRLRVLQGDTSSAWAVMYNVMSTQ